jgi:hypothetical protein
MIFGFIASFLVRVLLPLTVLLFAGCIPGTGIAPTRDSVGTTFSTKEVVAKYEPDLLLARDGSTCRVSSDRFAAAGVGRLLRCNWRPA